MILDRHSVRCSVMATIAAVSFSESVLGQAREQGVEVSVITSSFFGGDAGPTVLGGPLASETLYDDTFGSGFAVAAQYFRQLGSVFRWQIGFIHQDWPGEFFEGGEFQGGWEFGAGGKFDDLRLTGIYGGFTAIRGRGAKIRPFAAIDLAIVNLSDVNVVVSGVGQPYWTSTTKDYLLIKGGLSYEISPKASVTCHVGFSVLGRPDSVNIFSAGTAGSALNLGVGFSYSL